MEILIFLRLFCSYGQWIGSGITATDYRSVTAALRRAARDCGAPVVSVLEGGYNLAALKDNVFAHCTGLLDDGSAMPVELLPSTSAQTAAMPLD